MFSGGGGSGASGSMLEVARMRGAAPAVLSGGRSLAFAPCSVWSDASAAQTCSLSAATVSRCCCHVCETSDEVLKPLPSQEMECTPHMHSSSFKECWRCIKTKLHTQLARRYADAMPCNLNSPSRGTSEPTDPTDPARVMGE